MSTTGKLDVKAINAIIGGKVTWYPAYRNDKGTFISERATFPVYINYPKNKAGIAPEPSNFMATVWGPMECGKAAFYFSKGKVMQIFGELEIHQIPLTIQGQIVTQISTGKEYDHVNRGYYQAGQTVPVMTTRVNFNATETFFGMESNQTLALRDVQLPGWRTEGTPGNVEWKQYLTKLKAIKAQGWHGGEMYGFAKVGKVNGTVLHLVDGHYVPLTNAVATQGAAANVLPLPGAAPITAPANTMPLPGTAPAQAPAQAPTTVTGTGTMMKDPADGKVYELMTNGMLREVIQTAPATGPLTNMLPAVPGTATAPNLPAPGNALSI